MGEQNSNGLRNLGVLWVYIVVALLAIDLIRSLGLSGAVEVLLSLVVAVALGVLTLLAYDRLFVDSA